MSKRPFKKIGAWLGILASAYLAVGLTWMAASLFQLLCIDSEFRGIGEFPEFSMVMTAILAIPAWFSLVGKKKADLAAGTSAFPEDRRLDRPPLLFAIIYPSEGGGCANQGGTD